MNILAGTALILATLCSIRADATSNHFIEAGDVVNIREKIETASGRKWKNILGFGGYSASGYEDPETVARTWRSILESVPKSERRRTLILTGGTESGVGAVADLAASMGFPVAGLASERAAQEKIHPKVQNMFFVRDPGWGGNIKGSARLQPASHALALAVDQLHVVGGGEVSAMEYVLTNLSGKKVSFTPADMKHDYARQKNLNPAGAAYDIIVPERLQTARLIHESWRAPLKNQDGTYKPVIREVVENGKTVRVDIANFDFDRLPKYYQDLNIESARVFLDAIEDSSRQGPFDLNRIVMAVHRNYLERTRGLKGAVLEEAVQKISPADRAKTTLIVEGAIEYKDRHSETNRATFELAEAMHEKWRSSRKKDPVTGRFEPRFKIYDGQSIDIANLDFRDLPRTEQYRNLVVARASIQQLEIMGIKSVANLDQADPQNLTKIYQAVHEAYNSVNGVAAIGAFDSLPAPHQAFVRDTVSFAITNASVSCSRNFTKVSSPKP